MDPYLESHWRDVHHCLITYARDALQECLPADLVARADERIVFETPEGLTEGKYPDVRVVERPWEKAPQTTPESGVAVAEPFVIRLNREALTEGYVEIIDVGSGHRVVTTIEFLSPTNKRPGDGRDKYLEKQQEVLRSEASLVEIDFIRAGLPTLMIRDEQVPPRLRTTCKVCVHRGWESDRFLWYTAPLQQRLPVIAIPLRQADAEVPLDLQALIDLCYRRGRYELDFDYRTDPEPPLEGTDAAWAEQLLQEKGLRPKRPGGKQGKGRRPKSS
jgi:hypothetical protein